MHICKYEEQPTRWFKSSHFFLSSDGDDLVRSSLAIRDNKVGKLLDELLHCKTLRLVFLLDLQGSAKRWAPGLVTFVTALPYHFRPALPAAFTQPVDHNLSEPCRVDRQRGVNEVLS